MFFEHQNALFRKTSSQQPANDGRQIAVSASRAANYLPFNDRRRIEMANELRVTRGLTWRVIGKVVPSEYIEFVTITLQSGVTSRRAIFKLVRNEL